MAKLTPVPAPSAPEHNQFYHNKECDILARTLWGEARNQGDEGMQAVACVIKNRAAIARAKGGYWWGDDIISICLKPYQFSCWLQSDPNYAKLQAVDEKDLQFATALRIAKRAQAGVLGDITGGATHYHTRSISPTWAIDATPSATIGAHVFYKLI